MKTLQEIKKEIKEGKKPHYIYLLLKPDETPFYVGKGMSNRVSAHEAETRYFMNGRTWTGINMFKINVIKKIWNEGGQVLYLIDSWHDTSESASDREIELVKLYGRRILEEGPLTNIRDGGNLWSEETRKLFAQRMIQWHKENPYTEEHKQHLSDMLKSFCQANPEFIDNLQYHKDKWIEEYPNEYEEAERKRLEICQSEAHREMISNIMSEYFMNNPDELERLKNQGANFWIDNDEAREVARQRAIENKSHENIIRWLEEEPELCREKWDKHSDYMKSWYENNPVKAKELADNRNQILKSDYHREKMSKKTKSYMNNNPKVALDRVDCMKKGVQELKLIRDKCLKMVRDKLVEEGEIEYCEPTSKRVTRWKSKGLIKKYFPQFPENRTKSEWEKFNSLFVKLPC